MLIHRRAGPEGSLSCLMEDSEYRKTTLSNGLRVLTASMPHARSVAVSVCVGAGSRYETPSQAGLAHFIEHLCFKGTERHPSSQELSQVVDRGGGSINAGTDREMTVFYCKATRPPL